MKVAHKNETENDCADAKEFDFVVTLDAAGEIICDCAVEFDDQEAYDYDGDTAEKPCPTKCPLHVHIIAY